MPSTDEFLDTPEKSEAEKEAERVAAEAEAKTLADAKDNLEDLSKEDLAAALLKMDEKNRKLAESNTQLHGRLTKAKESKEPKEVKNPKEQPTVDIEEQIDLRFLKRDGLSDEQIADLKFIQAGQKAMGKSVSLMECVNDPMYKARQEQRDATVKRAKAQVDSNGSSFSEEQKKVSEMSDADHAKFAQEEAEKLGLA